jgi:rSAM/selenodomain-associated transferase 2
MTGVSTKSANNPYLSIIIPVLNEEAHIGHLIEQLPLRASKPRDFEIIVVDGGSTDATTAIVKNYAISLLTSGKGRALQMNSGARKAKGKILYFLHADTLPPLHFDEAIKQAAGKGYQAGCFRMKFNAYHWFFSFFAWFTRFNFLLCRGGDQSLFINRELFFSLEGFSERYQIYEDNEFIGRIYRNTGFKVLPQNVITSARKYRQNGMFRLQYHFARIHLMNYLGAPPESLYAYYSRHIRSR